MPKLTAFDRSTARVLSAEVVKALASVGAEFGVTFTYAGGRFSAEEFTLKLSAKVGDASNVAAQNADKAKREFELHCHAFGLKPEHFGHVFRFQSNDYRICGIKPGAPKFPVLAARVRGGKVFKFPLEATGLVTAEQAGQLADGRAELAFERRANRF